MSRCKSFFFPFITISLLLDSGEYLSAQSFKILHYSETSGYEHQTRDVSYSMFQQLGSQFNFQVDHDSTGDAFSSLSNLMQYKAIVFANTTGDAILDSTQRNNFEQYINNGGNVIGIHSATDTYRHSTANGANSGVWDFYPELIGASVQQNPSHVSGTPSYNMHFVQSHSLLNDIPDPWYKAEEYYYWQYGYFDSLNNNVLLKVETTIGPNALVNSYDSTRATTWFKLLPGGNRIFYTSLGHAVSNYTADTTFIALIRNAVLWTAGETSIQEFSDSDILIYPNPFSQSVFIEIKYPGKGKTEAELINAMTNVCLRKILIDDRAEIDVTGLADGIYFLKFNYRHYSVIKKLMRIGVK